MKKRPVLARRALLATLIALLVGEPAAAVAAPITKRQAQRTARRAASRYTERLGISYPSNLWRAACRRARQRVALRGGHGGHCSGRLTVYGTSMRPRTRNIRIDCFD
jgi:hypothetical protein